VSAPVKSVQVPADPLLLRKMFGGGDTSAPTTENADEVEGILESKPLPIMLASEARLVTSELGLAISDRELRTFLCSLRRDHSLSLL
jgi:hypothetical protein